MTGEERKGREERPGAAGGSPGGETGRGAPGGDAGPVDGTTGEVPWPRPLDRLGLLVAGITHNLMGPLTGILGTLDLLKLKHPEIAPDLERIRSLGRRMETDIRNILAKARDEATGQVILADLREIVAREIAVYKGDPRLKHKIEVVFEPPEEFPRFHAPAGDFSEIISNLLTNAVEAMEKSEEKRLTITLAEEEGNVRLSLADTGVGMDRETLARAREPFFTTKEPTSGDRAPAVLATGLGLTLVDLLVERMGGRLTLESEPGAGTTVTIDLPWKRIDRRYRDLLGGGGGPGL